MRTHDLGRIFLTRCKVNRGVWPLVQRATSHEITKPYRIGEGIALRVCLETGIAIGVWGSPRSVSVIDVSREIGDPWHTTDLTEQVYEPIIGEQDEWVIEDLTEVLQEATEASTSED